MGVFIELPVDSKLHVYVANAFGSITAVDNDSNNITCRLLLDRGNIPEYVLCGLGENELVQTNALLQVPFKWVAGTFRLWPPSLFQAECIPQDTETSMGNKFLGRIVVCDMQIFPDEEAASCSEEGNTIMVTFETFAKLLQGRLRLTLSRLKPFPAQAALAYIFHIHELEGGLSPALLQWHMRNI